MNILRLLEYAVALDAHRSFGRAAEAMNVTQPTFSRGIAALEAAIGARLFDRSNRRVEPTAAGALLLARGRPLLSDAAGLREVLGDYQNLRSGRVSIGAGPYALDVSVLESVARFASRHPLMQVELVEGRWRDFGPKLLAGDLDLAVSDLSIVSADPRFHAELLPAHTGAFYCRAGHPLAGRGGLTPRDILRYPLVGVRLPLRVLSPAEPDTPGLTLDAATGDVMPRITTTSFAASRAIVKCSDGVGLAVPAQIAEDVRRGSLVLLDADAGTLRTQYGIVTLRGKSLSPGAQVFAAVLGEVEAELAGVPGVHLQRTGSP